MPAAASPGTRPLPSAEAARSAPRGRNDEVEIGLLAADQLDIDLGQDLGVEQRAVLGAPGVVDAVAGAERIEAVRRARMLAPRQRQGVDGTRSSTSAGWPVRANSALRKPISKAALWITSRRVADEAANSSATAAKTGLSARNALLRPCTPKAPCRHRAFGIEVGVVEIARRDVVEEFDAADLDDPVARGGVGAGGFGVENDLAQHVQSSRIAVSSRRPAPGRPASTQDRAHLRLGRRKAPARVHKEMGSPPLFGVRHLLAQDGRNLLLASCRAAPGPARAGRRRAP